MRGLNVCVLGPAALILTAVLIALTPMTSGAAEQRQPLSVNGDQTAAATDSPGATNTSETIIAADGTVCDVTDAAITWGLKESLRSYISGTIANGEWTVSDGATYETPDFGWTAGSGQLDAGSGTLAFDGSLRLTGHDGILDTTLTGLEIVFDGSTTANLVFDVFGTTQEGLPVDETDVEFATIDVSSITVAAGTALLESAPVVLTEAGSDAFGTYPAGEELDPITVTFSATPDCMPQPQDVNQALLSALIIIGAIIAILVAIAIVLVLGRRRRRNRAEAM
ncbi:HtaA domain-containing protein [Salinibacterium sp. SWN139]|uniref:HtaA domain-containing protein n=1 Tax=Salinibacterium sp. SWN139 TaxID=2792055 RepID=UPI0018CD7014|nr:HtaA domain-containing protein [Salinibacterium sp. SWN139]MBH0053494.1 HtaA domain-containing protein [Salinibacterium sp. SWN139]